jgi:hypothetical protein
MNHERGQAVLDKRERRATGRDYAKSIKKIRIEASRALAELTTSGRIE